jgi:hypothetical protein
MSTIDSIRNRLIDQILASNNEKLLNAIFEIFQSADSNEYKAEMNSFHLEMIQMGLSDIENNNTTTDDDLRQADEEWMS